MKPILIIFGLVIGALIGGKLGTLFGAEYVAQQTYESPDEQGDLYFLVFVGSAALCAVTGAFLGWLLGLLFSGKKT